MNDEKKVKSLEVHCSTSLQWMTSQVQLVYRRHVFTSYLFSWCCDLSLFPSGKSYSPLNLESGSETSAFFSLAKKLLCLDFLTPYLILGQFMSWYLPRKSFWGGNKFKRKNRIEVLPIPSSNYGELRKHEHKQLNQITRWVNIEICIWEKV